MAKPLRFERNPSRVVFDPDSSSFVVTWTKCGIPQEQRLAGKRDLGKCMPSIMSIATLFDRGIIPLDRMVFAARSISRAWNAGDRDSLDTEQAKAAAELVSDISTMCVDPGSEMVSRDLRQAMRHLVDEIAHVRFMATPLREFSDEASMPALERATAECLSVEGFASWPPYAMRRRMMYCFSKRERSEVKYTLVSLFFGVGSCPLLSLSDRRTLRMQAMSKAGDIGSSAFDYACRFWRYSLSKMREMKERGVAKLGCTMSQQQLSDCVMLEDSSPI